MLSPRPPAPHLVEMTALTCLACRSQTQWDMVAVARRVAPSRSGIEVRDVRALRAPAEVIALCVRGDMLMRAAVDGPRQLGLAVLHLRPSPGVLALRRGWGPLLDPLLAGSALLGPLVITTDHERQAVARALVVDAVHHARREGRGSLAFHVAASDLDAIDLYQRLRFELLRQVRGPDGMVVEMGLLIRAWRD